MTRYVDLENPTPESEEELSRLLQALHKKKKIVVIAGAGISVSAGIPDFRSSTGLFTTLRGQHGIRGSGKHLFDASVYKHDASTSSFHTMVRELAHMTQNARPTPFHHLLASLAHEGRLMRLYSQNIDCIDTALKPLKTNVPLNAKGPWPVTIQLHGGLQKMVCSKCGQLEDFDGSLFQGPEPPLCQQCVMLDAVRTSIAGKRSHGIGRLRPRIVLYNEYNPDEEAIGNVSKADLRRGPDAVIVVGTSLKIPGVRRLVKELCQVTRSRRDGLAAWINVDSEPQGAEFKECWDTIVHGSSDDIALLANLPHWDQQEDIDSPSNWMVSGKEGRAENKLEVVLDSSLPKPLTNARFCDTDVKKEDAEVEATDNAAHATVAHTEPASTAIPTPISSPKPARKRLPGERKTVSATQRKLPFQQVKKADIGPLVAKSEKHAGIQADTQFSDKKKASKLSRKPRQSKAKKEAKSRATDLTFAFRATKNIAESTPVAKKRKPLPSSKPGLPEVSDYPSSSDNVKHHTSSDLTKLPNLYDKSYMQQAKDNGIQASVSSLQFHDVCTPPPASPTSPAICASPPLTISPKSKPNGMGLLID